MVYYATALQRRAIQGWSPSSTRLSASLSRALRLSKSQTKVGKGSQLAEIFLVIHITGDKILKSKRQRLR